MYRLSTLCLLVGICLGCKAIVSEAFNINLQAIIISNKYNGGSRRSETVSRSLHVLTKPQDNLPINKSKLTAGLHLSAIDREETRIAEDELPWTDFQAWALRDNIMKYIVSIPKPGATKPELYALWRTMSREHAELSGYPIEMLVEKCRQQLETIKLENGGKNPIFPHVPAVLPLLDSYEFETSGGLSGSVYGVPGIAAGTYIQTTCVRDVQLTVPKGYVLTDQEGIAYELGSPRRDLDASLDNNNIDKTVLENTAKALSDAAKNVKQPLAILPVDEDGMLVKLGASTAILLAGASAVGALSHHLTVNVFWV